MLSNVLLNSQIPIDPQNIQDIVYAARQVRTNSPYSTGWTDTRVGVLNPALMQQQTPDRLATSTLSDLAQNSNNGNLLGTGMSWEQIQKNKEFLQRSGLDKPSGVPLDGRYLVA